MILFLICPAGAQEPEPAPRRDLFGCPGGSWPWEGQGEFVNIPASLAAAPGGVLGTALAVAFIPADLIEAGVSKKRNDEPIPRFAHAGVCAGVYLGKGLSYPVGGIFWLLKKAFWDGPKRLFTPKEGNLPTSSGVPLLARSGDFW